MRSALGAMLVVLAVSASVGAQSAGPHLVPPRLLESPPPAYPPEREAEGEHPTIVLVVTLDGSGRVTEVEIEHGFDDDFDRAAIEAVKRWRFEPARRGDRPVASRIHVAVHFELPHFDLHGPRGMDEMPELPEPVEVHLEPSLYTARAVREAERLRSEERGPSDIVLDSRALRRTPSLDAGSLLLRAPGVFVARTEGEAVAQGVMLRGFDADHGQDVELTIEGLPINQPSHIHGQGYADLGFIIPEVVRRVRVIEGVYDPRQGDFAVAGSADFELGVENRGVLYQSTAGSFRTFRQLAIVAPRDAEVGTFAAADFHQTAGFGANRAAHSGRVLGQWVMASGPRTTRVLGSFHASRASLAGVVRRDDVENGVVDFLGVYPYATTEAQSANTLRAQLAFFHDVRLDKGANTSVAASVVYQRFGIFQNFTGFTERSVDDPDWIGRGDLFDQRQDALRVLFQGRYRSPRLAPLSWLAGHAELGVAGRLDRIDQDQTLVEAPQMRVWDRRIDASITGLDVGIYLDLDFALGERLKLKGGARADLLSYDVTNRLGHRIPYGRPPEYVEGLRTTSLGVAAGPRLAAEVLVHPMLRLLAAYGEGFRSPDATTLGEGERAPYTKVRSADVGARLDVGEKVRVLASGFLTQLSDDVYFDASEGRLERLAPSRRSGLSVFAEAAPLEWLRASLSATYVRGVLLEAQAASVEDPDPAFRRGEAIPYVPPWVLRAELGGGRVFGRVEKHDVLGSFGVAYQAVGKRPLPFGQKADDIHLLDAVLRLRLGVLHASLEGLNLTGRPWAAEELVYASNFNPAATPSRIPARHLKAGAPRTILFTLGLHL
jgi:iron complex outermembrane recepter protein